jgi:hypothetical protein
MKTLNTLLTLSLLAISTACFATLDGSKPEKNMNVPVAPSVWESSQIEAPESLQFLKAKNAHVPLAGCVWGDPSDAPAHLSMVPVAPFVFGDSMENAPEELTFLKAKCALVPVAPFVWGDPSKAPAALSVK